ncbi:hypothetical protein JDFR1000234_80 [uncultured archaeal virus]|jgi:hypothetical protein|uniref:Uncharacterized protein n=1 Tax=uncultured archaeal virus TaxID=1960247 RepID=A0A1S5Y359_9VIRU|nr:hypothetical protein JDFR1000234_80 [uncultured archaeal virus]
MPERYLMVQFGVEKEVVRDFGYKELFLTYRGERTPYKGIIKDGELLAIVSRRYYLFENERLLRVLRTFSELYSAPMRIIAQTKTQVYVELKKTDSYTLLVQNSVDGTEALKVWYAYKIGEYPIPIVSKHLLYMKHIGARIGEVERELPEILSVFMNSIEQVLLPFVHILPREVTKEQLEEVKDIGIPDKYLSGLTLHTLTGNLTVGKLLARVSRKLWRENIKMVTRKRYFKLLLDLIFIWHEDAFEQIKESLRCIV